MGYTVAVIGATGNVGREILQTLAERKFPADKVIALASEKSIGQEVSYGEDDILKVQDIAKFDFKGVDIALFSSGSKVSAAHVPRAAAAGCVVIDNSSQFRMDPDVPLVVPEVNPQALAGFRQRNIVANPSGPTIQMVMALKPLHDRFAIRRVVVSTYQAVSSVGVGKEAMDELFTQTRAIFVNDPIVKSVFPKQIAFNVIPQIDSVMEDGSTREEWKMMVETKKILDPKIKLSATCVRVPVFIGNAESVTIETDEPITAEEARDLLRVFPGLQVVDQQTNDGYITPVEVAGDNPVFISRIREDFSVENGLSFWSVADNLRKGSALNAVQIAERLVRDHLEG
ncbi:aspartate-semialdehyde dehydrogenase [Azospirillum sp. TSO35-2]|uniref:aspartate-semialdehyde dehydrogenase n=1 Tax=Azospirillum sp. TSO35-2 TaxID=716796 RepID=UPI000D611562|nr:aspartate-semialdehyde dehydrogenase [Azospirillum sp. TSO35-2]PWC34257.1 aspartate-semialdehyde dehydrogenase [Azospirillum sp. TSO35-2]